MSILIIGWIVFAVGSALLAWVEFQDDKWSETFDLTANGEGNWWSRGSDGYYSRTKALRNTLIVFGACLAVAIFVPMTDWTGAKLAPLLAGIVLAGIAGGIWSKVHKNVEEFRNKRDEQLAILKAIKTGGIASYTHKPFRYTHEGRYFYIAGPHFWDIRFETTASGQADPAVQAEAKAYFDQVLTRIAAKPESQWFTKGRTN